MLKEIMIFMMQSKLKNLLLLRVPMKLLLFLKILMMPLTNLRALLYFSIALKIIMTIIILLIILRESLHPKEETNVLQDSMEEEIAQTESSLDENEEESDKQKEEEWSHPCLPSNDSNSLNLTLYECYDPMDSFEISLFDEVDAFYTYGLDATMDDAYKDELSIVLYVKHEIIAIAPHLNVMGCIYLIILKTV